MRYNIDRDGRGGLQIEGAGKNVEKLESILGQAGVTRYGFCRTEGLLTVASRRRFAFDPAFAVIAIFPYRTEDAAGNLCLYARLPDYHTVVGARLQCACDALSAAFPASRFAAAVDASPLCEAAAAVHAGLGTRGVNGLLITPEFGSYVFIGAILTDLPLPARSAPDRGCLGCGACLRACPTGALGAEGVDETRCLSAITQKKGELSEAEQAAVRQGGLVWGCDVCQTVCPMNRCAKPTDLPEFISDVHPNLTLADLENASWLSGRACGWRGRGPLERNLRLLSTT